MIIDLNLEQRALIALPNQRRNIGFRVQTQTD
jgi:hypothetical protein